MSDSISIIRYRAPDDDAAFVAFLGTVAEEAGTRWVLQLEPRAFLGSAAFGALLGWQKHLHELDGLVVLAQAGRGALRVLRMLGLDEILQVFDTEADAVAFLGDDEGSHDVTIRIFPAEHAGAA